MAAEQPLLLTEPGLPPLHSAALQMQSGVSPGQNLKYQGDKAVLEIGGFSLQVRQSSFHDSTISVQRKTTVGMV